MSSHCLPKSFGKFFTIFSGISSVLSSRKNCLTAPVTVCTSSSFKDTYFVPLRSFDSFIWRKSINCWIIEFVKIESIFVIHSLFFGVYQCCLFCQMLDKCHLFVDFLPVQWLWSIPQQTSEYPSIYHPSRLHPKLCRRPMFRFDWAAWFPSAVMLLRALSHSNFYKTSLELHRLFSHCFWF